MRVGLDIRPLTASPFAGVSRQVLALYNTLRMRPDTEAIPFTSAPHTHAHRTWAYCPSFEGSVDGLAHLRERYRFEKHFLPEAISGLAVDVHIATANKGLPFGLTDVRRQRTKWVLMLSDPFDFTLPEPRSRWRERATQWIERHSIRYASRLADAIWVPSGYTAEMVSSVLPETRNRIRVLPYAVPVEAWGRLQHEIYPPMRYWLLVGTHRHRHNMPSLVRAWQKACEQWPQETPDLVCVGTPKSLPTVPARVRFVQGLSDAQLASWYRRAERVWHPALAEGFGLPVIEAAACGTPVATSLGSALDEIAPPGALRFDPTDESALTDLMRQAALQGRGAQESETALLQWARRFDLPMYAARVNELLEELA